MAKKSNSEFSVVDEDDDEAEVDFRQRKRGSGDLLVINEDAKSRQRSEEIEFDDSDGSIADEQEYHEPHMLDRYLIGVSKLLL